MSTTQGNLDPTQTTERLAERIEGRSAVVVWSSLLFAALQSICTALVAASGLRTAIGAGAFALSSTTLLARFHHSEIRDPMLLLATAGSLLDLILLWQVRRLRNRPASQWRQKPPSRRKLRMEQVQLLLSLFTLLLVGAELAAHFHLHGTVLTWVMVKGR